MSPNRHLSLPHPFTPALAALAALAPTGCGSLADGQYAGEPIATFTGTLTTQGAVTLNGPVSLAILWFPEALGSMEEEIPPPGEGDDPIPGDDGEIPSLPCDGEPWPFERQSTTLEVATWVSQSVSYQAQFPISFTVPMLAVPPAEVQVDLSTYGGSGRMSLGTLVAYEDLNANGRFDQGRPGQPGDRILAVSATATGQQILVFLDGQIPAGSEEFAWVDGTIPQGFSRIVQHPNDPERGLVVPGATAINLVISDDEASQLNAIFFGCAAIEYRYDFGGPLPAGAEPFCDEGGAAYSWFAPRTEIDACVFSFGMGGACLDPELTPPASWPCP